MPFLKNKEKFKSSNSSGEDDQMTYRLAISLPDGCDMVVRVNPNTVLSEVFYSICKQYNFDSSTHMVVSEELHGKALNLKRKFHELKINQIQILSKADELYKSMPDLRDKSMFGQKYGDNKLKNKFFNLFKRNKSSSLKRDKSDSMICLPQTGSHKPLLKQYTSPISSISSSQIPESDENVLQNHQTSPGVTLENAHLTSNEKTLLTRYSSLPLTIANDNLDNTSSRSEEKKKRLAPKPPAKIDGLSNENDITNNTSNLEHIFQPLRTFPKSSYTSSTNHNDTERVEAKLVQESDSFDLNSLQNLFDHRLAQLDKDVDYSMKNPDRKYQTDDSLQNYDYLSKKRGNPHSRNSSDSSGYHETTGSDSGSPSTINTFGSTDSQRLRGSKNHKFKDFRQTDKNHVILSSSEEEGSSENILPNYIGKITQFENDQYDLYKIGHQERDKSLNSEHRLPIEVSSFTDESASTLVEEETSWDEVKKNRPCTFVPPPPPISTPPPEERVYLADKTTFVRSDNSSLDSSISSIRRHGSLRSYTSHMTDDLNEDFEQTIAMATELWGDNDSAFHTYDYSAKDFCDDMKNLTSGLTVNDSFDHPKLGHDLDLRHSDESLSQAKNVDRDKFNTDNMIIEPNIELLAKAADRGKYQFKNLSDSSDDEIVEEVVVSTLKKHHHKAHDGDKEILKNKVYPEKYRNDIYNENDVNEDLSIDGDLLDTHNTTGYSEGNVETNSELYCNKEEVNRNNERRNSASRFSRADAVKSLLENRREGLNERISKIRSFVPSSETDDKADRSRRTSDSTDNPSTEETIVTRNALSNQQSSGDLPNEMNVIKISDNYTSTVNIGHGLDSHPGNTSNTQLNSVSNSSPVKRHTSHVELTLQNSDEKSKLLHRVSLNVKSSNQNLDKQHPDNSSKKPGVHELVSMTQKIAVWNQQILQKLKEYATTDECSSKLQEILSQMPEQPSSLQENIKDLSSNEDSLPEYIDTVSQKENADRQSNFMKVQSDQFNSKNLAPNSEQGMTLRDKIMPIKQISHPSLKAAKKFQNIQQKSQPNYNLQLTPREELMIAVRNAQGLKNLRMVPVKDTKWST